MVDGRREAGGEHYSHQSEDKKRSASIQRKGNAIMKEEGALGANTLEE
jgi:hypothetical protein